jgi:late competence protein required for DNA uptake (superfamily II DNA/RNA helicase)
MGVGDSDLGRYEQALGERVKAGEVVCSRCGNREEFMVNEIGHVFCRRCHAKIPMLRLE